MADTLTFRLAELLGTDHSCGVITLEDIEAIAQGRLSPDRQAHIDRHAASCPFCEELLADLSRFLRACAPGGGRTRSSFLAADEKTRAALGLAPRRRSIGPRFPFLAAAALLIGAVGFALYLPARPFPVNTATARLIEPPVVRGASPRAAIEQARSALMAGDFREARQVLDEALETYHGNTFLLHDRGVVLLRGGDVRGAVESLRASADAQGAASAETLFWLGVALSRNGEPDAACSVMERVSHMRDSRSEQARQIAERHCPKN